MNGWFPYVTIQKNSRLTDSLISGQRTLQIGLRLSWYSSCKERIICRFIMSIGQTQGQQEKADAHNGRLLLIQVYHTQTQTTTYSYTEDLPYAAKLFSLNCSRKHYFFYADHTPLLLTKHQTKYANCECMCPSLTGRRESVHSGSIR